MSPSLETLVAQYVDALEWNKDVVAAWIITESGDADQECSATLDRSNEDYEIAYDALAEWTRHSRRDGWRPISEAPKDGTEVLVTGFMGNDPARGRWQAVAHYADEVWENGDITIFDPTHFMPLPEPPEDVRPEVMAMLENDITEHAELWAAMAKA